MRPDTKLIAEMVRESNSTMRKLPGIILIATFPPFCWLAMQAVHEFGHVIGAWATGVEVTHVALYPTIFARTVFDPYPPPLAVDWAGPVVGSLLPLAAFGLASVCRIPGVSLLRFFAGFCLIVNGAYIAFGPSRGADTGGMISHGTPRLVMVLFGACTIPLGLYLWHRMGPRFGLKDARPSAAIASVILLAAIVGLELLVGSR